MDFRSTLISIVSDERIVISVLFIVLVLAARWLLIRMIRRGAEILSDGQRRWITQIRNGTLVAILVALAFTWLPEIHTFALSITAVAIAVVIATKELILCLSGTVYRVSANPFQIGDWVEIGPHFGEVVDHSLASTTLQEVDRHDYVHTGRAIVVPNSLLLIGPIINQSFSKRYVFHSFTLEIEPDANPFEAIEPLRAVIEAEAEEFAEVARRYNAFVEKRSGIDIPGPDPRFAVTTSELAKPVLTVTIFCPTERTADLQFRITEAFFAWYFANRSPHLSVMPPKSLDPAS